MIFLFVSQAYMGDNAVAFQACLEAWASRETYKWASFFGRTEGTDWLDEPAGGGCACARVVSDDGVAAPVVVVIVFTGGMSAIVARSRIVTADIHIRRIIPSLVHNPRAWVEAVLPPLKTSTTRM